jgi:hypothetical protein
MISFCLVFILKFINFSLELFTELQNFKTEELGEINKYFLEYFRKMMEKPISMKEIPDVI